MQITANDNRINTTANDEPISVFVLTFFKGEQSSEIKNSSLQVRKF